MTSTTQVATPQTSTTTWNIDPSHSLAEFKVKHMMIANVKGQFSKVSGALFLDESDLANSRVEAAIEAASMSRSICASLSVGNDPSYPGTSGSIIKDSVRRLLDVLSRFQPTHPR